MAPNQLRNDGNTVALALSLPANEFKPTALTITCTVVLFSIIVQGLIIKPLIAWTVVHDNIEDV
ncbi:MAG: hypothetical protein P8M18_03030 [Woeseiaceae bacterium]|nr:hypothetical protein [Woeseiaceae bacterium]